ncbi:MAG: hypothetical protein D6781_12810 [Verrucomicrobia bacterium]|nr:MAG: hypothetical protein D6781_12810 [Verrucomicrobiota bacterium]
MKLQLKRKSEPAVLPRWHPDFRNPELLPDLKVVRTSFFLNVICATLAVAALLMTAFREYTAASIRRDIEAAERRIEETRQENARYLALNREFMEAAKKLTESHEFMKSSLKASEVLIALSRSLPITMDFTTITYNGESMTLQGNIRGLSETASSRLDAYLDVLRNDPVVGKQFPNVKLTSLLRNPSAQGLQFEIHLSPEAGGK